jgi:hypothetical protein
MFLGVSFAGFAALQGDFLSATTSPNGDESPNTPE